MQRYNFNKSSPIKIPENEVLRILHQHNPWWIHKPIPAIKLKPFKRRDYYKILDRLSDNKILGLMGPRQVGKTTLIFQLIEKLLSEVEPTYICFVSLDDPYLDITLKSLGNIFDLYAINILKQPLNELDNRVYIFLDEIQGVKNCETILKRWYDLGYRMKFVVTGSSSINITEGASEALVGRIQPQVVFPMKFLEYIRFKEESIAELVQSNNKNMREALKVSLTQNTPEEFYRVVEEQFKALLPYRDRILIHLNYYFIKGGYPEISSTDDMITAGQYLRNYLHLTLYKDIIRTNKVRDPVALENLFAILSKESSNRINVMKLAPQLGLERKTMNTYIYLLKMAFLISEAEFYSPSRVKRARREKKIFINDVGIRNVSASVFDDNVLTYDTEMGKIVETVVADHTRRLRFNLEAIPFPSLFYWSERYEVDFVIDPLGRTIPIEVKYREKVEESDLKGLKSFNEKFKPSISLVITKDQLFKRDLIVFMPVWLYLLIC
jgi:uncharacterized protein